MPFACIDLLQGKPADYRATLADIIYRGIVDVLKAPDRDRFVVISEHPSENLIYEDVGLVGTCTRRADCALPHNLRLSDVVHGGPKSYR